MLSLISIFNKQQVNVRTKRILRDITDRAICVWDNKQIYSCFVFNRRLITVILNNRKFTVRMTCKLDRRYAVFSYKTNGFKYDNFTRGIKRFIKAILSSEYKSRQIRNSFKFISLKYISDITEMDTEYLLVVERRALNCWYKKVPYLSGDFVSP